MTVLTDTAVVPFGASRVQDSDVQNRITHPTRLRIGCMMEARRSYETCRGVKHMPVLSMFFGIIVRMYRESGGKHNVPHIHAEYSGDEVVVALDGTVLEGAIPRNKFKLLEAWVIIHRDELEANWRLLSNGEQFFRIEPLQ